MPGEGVSSAALLREPAACSLPGNARRQGCVRLAGPGTELESGDLAPEPGYGESQLS